MKTFINKPVTKNIILGVLVLIIGGLCSAIGTWDFTGDKYIIPKIIALIVFFVIYVGLSFYYTTREVNSNRKIGILKRQNEAYENSMVGIISICEQSTKDVNKIIHEIIDEGKINLNIWSFNTGCRLVCEKIYNSLCSLHGESKEFGVSYVRLDETDPNQIIYMNAFYNKNMSEPTIHMQKRNINDEHAYHDAELFKKNKSDIEVLPNKESIRKVFDYKDTSTRVENENKYNQYIAIPVICGKDNGGKMVGLLEIVCFYDTELGKTDKEIREIASKYFVPYAYLLLILHKLEKALIAQPQNPRTGA